MNASDTVDAEQPAPGAITGALRLALPAGTGRLVQNELATRLQEGLLLALAMCAVASFVLIGWRDRAIRVLPMDPGSIATRMALFEGSELVGRLRREGGGGDGGGDKGARHGVWEGPMFGLRWLGRGGGLDNGR